MVGYLSTSYLASMSVGNQIFDFFITVFNFISVGCSVVISQYIGAGKKKKSIQAIHIAISFNFLLGCISSGVILFFGNVLLNLMNTPIHLFNQSILYLEKIGLCLILESISIITSACLRIYGRSQSAMIVTLISNLIIVVGNLIFLFGYFGIDNQGLIGISYSTLIGRTISLFALLFLLFNNSKIRFVPHLFFNWSKEILNKMLQIGLPSAGENLVWTIHYMIICSFIGTMGEKSMAAQTLYFQLSLFIMLFGLSISIGNEIIVGHLIGSKKFEKAYLTGLKSLRTGFIVTILVVFLFWTFKTAILKLIIQDEEIIKLLVPLFLLSIFLEPGRTLNIVMVNSLRATGDVNFPFFVAIFSMCGIAIPLCYFLGIVIKMGLFGIWIGFLFDEWIRGVINSFRWKSKKWSTKRLDL
ncbi:Multi antimicrobial extrusion protein (Na(+)/drug antiporter), MATE family of MDR efflux pump [Candidatus Riesia pediculischaeffi PTSU]|nr:Multi antimicrobial extrusion protein (Na(+)/drug antiporter), MATE family of MDR efflux pump [Candidatus Riesia pediculischaeffi PTSU]